MPVPEIEVPTVQPEARPVVQTPVAPLGAFAGAHVGAGLGKVGEELFGVGMQAYNRAAEAQAQEKETEFQDQALKLRDQYRSLYNMDAISAHEEIRKKLSEAREDIFNTVTSKHGKIIYNNNSLRNMRLVQESIDSHFEQQNRSFQFGEHRKGQIIDVDMVAKLASDGNLKGASEKIKMMQEKAASFAGSHGLDPETESALVTRVAAHSLVKTMVDGKVPGAVEAFKQWGDKLDSSYQDSVQKTLSTQGVANAVQKILVNLPRVDADGKTNPRGRIDQVSLRQEMDAQPADEFGGRVRDKLKLEADRLDDQHKRAGEQMEERIVRLGQGRIPDGTTEWAEFEALYPVRAKILRKEANANLRRSVTEGRADEADAGKKAYGRAATRFYEASTEELKLITPQSVSSQMRGDGARAQDIERAQAKLLSLQSKKDPLGSEIPAVARDVLATGGPRFAKVSHWQAVEYLDSLHAQHPEWTRSQLGKDLSEHVVKNWLNRASLSLPQPTRPSAPQVNPPPGRYKKADGSVGDWDGARWLP